MIIFSLQSQITAVTRLKLNIFSPTQGSTRIWIWWSRYIWRTWARYLRNSISTYLGDFSSDMYENWFLCTDICIMYLKININPIYSRHICKYRKTKSSRSDRLSLFPCPQLNSALLYFTLLIATTDNVTMAISNT